MPWETFARNVDPGDRSTSSTISETTTVEPDRRLVFAFVFRVHVRGSKRVDEIVGVQQILGRPWRSLRLSESISCPSTSIDHRAG